MVAVPALAAWRSSRSKPKWCKVRLIKRCSRRRRWCGRWGWCCDAEEWHGDIWRRHDRDGKWFARSGVVSVGEMGDFREELNLQC